MAEIRAQGGDVGSDGPHDSLRIEAERRIGRETCEQKAILHSSTRIDNLGKQRSLEKVGDKYEERALYGVVSPFHLSARSRRM